MDPLSITTGCISLVATIGKLSFTISEFVHEVRGARAALDSVSRELLSLNTVLELLENDIAENSTVPFPETLRKQIIGIITNCTGVIQGIQVILDKHDGNKIHKAAQWALSGKDDVDKLKISLEAHKSALDIALDMVQLTLTRSIKDDTEQIRSDTHNIQGDMEQMKMDTAQILAEITRLRSQLPAETQTATTNFMLERYLDNLTNYAESVIGDEVPSPLERVDTLKEDFSVTPSEDWRSAKEEDVEVNSEYMPFTPPPRPPTPPKLGQARISSPHRQPAKPREPGHIQGLPVPPNITLHADPERQYRPRPTSFSEAVGYFPRGLVAGGASEAAGGLVASQTHALRPSVSAGKLQIGHNPKASRENQVTWASDWPSNRTAQGRLMYDNQSLPLRRSKSTNSRPRNDEDPDVRPPVRFLEVVLWKGNMILDLPVPDELLEKVPHAEPPGRDEFTHWRYSAVTCEASQFALQQYTLRPKLFAKPRKMELMVAIDACRYTWTYVDAVISYHIARTLESVISELERFYENQYLARFADPFGSWKVTSACIFVKGSQFGPTRLWLQRMGLCAPFQFPVRGRSAGKMTELFDDGVKYPLQVLGKPVIARIYEYTSQFKLKSLSTDVPFERGRIPVQIIVCVIDKEEEGGKPLVLDAYPWITALGNVMNARLAIRVESETILQKGSLLKQWRRDRIDEPIAGDGSDIKIVEYQKSGLLNLPWH